MFVKKFQMENYRCLSNYSCPKNTFKQKNDDGGTVAVIRLWKALHSNYGAYSDIYRMVQSIGGDTFSALFARGRYFFSVMLNEAKISRPRPGPWGRGRDCVVVTTMLRCLDTRKAYERYLGFREISCVFQ